MGRERVSVLCGVSAIVNRGEYVAVMGRSGSGKSTLMNILAAWTCRIEGLLGAFVRISNPFETEKKA